MPAFAIRVQGVEARYGAATVLDGIDLDIEPGTFTALLGSSGCGKTTLLRCISGLMKVHAGRIEAHGQDITDIAPEHRGMAMVFQSYALWPHMSVAQNIGYGLRLRRHGRREIAARVNDMLALLGLEGLGARRVTDLSGGQRQRVALGRALAIEPEILLLDEPLSNLDAKIRITMRHEIRAIQQRLGLTAIHVTHDREEAMVMADRIVIMSEGSIVQDGDPETVYRRPNSPFVASFLGADNAIGVDAAVENAVQSLTAHDGTVVGRLMAQQCAGRPLEGPLTVHFRAEAAHLEPADANPPTGLSLPGEITQVAYPGGRYRYSVATRFGSYLVDQTDRYAVGDRIALSVPAEALHLFADTRP